MTQETRMQGVDDRSVSANWSGRRQVATDAFRKYAPLMLVLALRLGSEATADLSYLILAAYALLGRPQVLRALMLSWLMSMLSPGLLPDASAAAVGRYGVLFAAALSTFLHRRKVNRRSNPFAVLTVILAIFIVAHSLIISSIAEVSLLKAITWAMAMTTSIAAWGSLTELELSDVANDLFWGLSLIMLASLPLGALALGYLRNGTGFQGVLNHPQVMGSAMALLGAWSIARALSFPRPPWWLLGLAALSLTVVLMSEARTGGLALLAGVTLAVVLGPFLGNRRILAMAPGLSSARVWGIVLAVLLAALIMSSTLQDFVSHYITKSGRTEVSDLLGAYDRSRGRLMDAMLENIGQHPWTGIGFGVASEPELMVIVREPVFGLPISASIEKGVTPLMVLEELGVFGAFFVGWWMLRLLSACARGGLAPFAVALTVLALNFGEATLFSPSGFGLLPIVLLGWAYACGSHVRASRYA